MHLFAGPSVTVNEEDDFQKLAFPSQSGSAAANAISQYIQAVVLFIYICVMGLHKATWPGG